MKFILGALISTVGIVSIVLSIFYLPIRLSYNLFIPIFLVGIGVVILGVLIALGCV